MEDIVIHVRVEPLHLHLLDTMSQDKKEAALAVCDRVCQSCILCS